MTADRPICSEVYWPEWSSRGMRSVRCEHPAKVEAFKRTPPSGGRWAPVCGVHARMYKRRRPLGGGEEARDG